MKKCWTLCIASTLTAFSSCFECDVIKIGESCEFISVATGNHSLKRNVQNDQLSCPYINDMLRCKRYTSW